MGVLWCIYSGSGFAGLLGGVVGLLFGLWGWFGWVFVVFGWVFFGLLFVFWGVVCWSLVVGLVWCLVSFFVFGIDLFFFLVASLSLKTR